MFKKNIIDGVIVLIAVSCFVLIVFCANQELHHNIYTVHKNVNTEYKNVIICESDLIQSCKTYKNVKVLDYTMNHIVIKDHENTFTLKGRIFNY